MARCSWSWRFLLCAAAAAPLARAHAEEQPAATPDGPADAAEPAAEEPAGLDQLAWMVGEWAEEAGADPSVATSVQWAANNRFITRVFSVTNGEGATLSGTQVIGWDPAEQQIRSWTFDTEGGFGEAYWTRDGSQWLIKKTFTLSTGEKASALNVITVVDENTVTWQSLNRQLGRELLPSIEPVTVVRQAADAAAAGEGASREEELQ